MNIKQIEKAKFAAREPGIPLFWHNLSRYAKGDYIILVKPPVSEYYYLNDSDETEAEFSFNLLKDSGKTKEIISNYSIAFSNLDKFSEVLEKIEPAKLGDDELKNIFQEMINIFSKILESYKETEEARFKKIEEYLNNWLVQNLGDEAKKAFLQLTSHEEISYSIDENKIKLLEKLGADQTLYNYIFAISKLSSLRLEMKEKFLGIFPKIAPVLTEIGIRYGIKEELFIISSDELKKILDNEAEPEKGSYNDRLKGYAFVQQNGKREIVSGKEFEDLEKHIHDLTVKKEIMEIAGQTAMSGKATGRVRKIIDYQKEWESYIKNFSKGDIIVTGMTQPNIVVLTGKASAIITDEGGVICHAAIISREFGVPCIVGTRVSTKILEEGELIEVDADNGIIKRLEKK